MGKKVLSKATSRLLVPADIGIVGYGIVGQALAYGFNQASNRRDRISFYDKYKISTPLQEVVNKSEFIFITLPTPMKQDESGIDLSIIDQNIAEMTHLTDHTDKIVVIKSTVIPGATREYATQYPNTKFAFNPEFLTEANHLRDFLEAERTVIGADEDLVRQRLGVLYSSRFPNSKLMLTDPTTAEMVKISANALLASRVTMANILDQLSNQLGIEWNEVKEMVVADPRIGSSHLAVTSVRGWGGKCFPKDWVNLMGLCKKLGVDTSVLKAIWKDNKSRRSVHDWEEIPFVVSPESSQKEF